LNTNCGHQITANGSAAYIITYTHIRLMPYTHITHISYT